MDCICKISTIDSFSARKRFKYTIYTKTTCHYFVSSARLLGLRHRLRRLIVRFVVRRGLLIAIIVNHLGREDDAGRDGKVRRMYAVLDAYLATVRIGLGALGLGQIVAGRSEDARGRRHHEVLGLAGCLQVEHVREYAGGRVE